MEGTGKWFPTRLETEGSYKKPGVRFVYSPPKTTNKMKPWNFDKKLRVATFVAYILWAALSLSLIVFLIALSTWLFGQAF